RGRCIARGRDQPAQAQGGRADHGPGHSAGGCEATPYDAGDVRRVMGTLPGVSMRRVCGVLGFPRARLRARAVLAAVPPRVDGALAERIQQLIERHPTFGYRRLWALLRVARGKRVNRKAVYRVLKLKGWLVHQRTVTRGRECRASRVAPSGATS